MIIAREEESNRFVTQGDHAYLAAEILSLFRRHELIDHPRRDRLLEAVREHDNGWRESDAAPRIDPATGSPLGFRRISGELRREIWSRSCERWADRDAYVALLIASHAIELHRERGAAEPWGEWLTGIRELRQELREALTLTPDDAASDYAWLRLADTCSLAICEGSTASFELGGFAGRCEADVLHLEPFPMAGRTTFRLPCRSLPQSTFGSDRELGRALATARWHYRPVSVAPAASA